MSLHASQQQQASAEAFLHSLLLECIRNNSQIAHLERDIEYNTHTTLLDWVDHFLLSNSHVMVQKLEEHGFVSRMSTQEYTIYSHACYPALPRVVLHRGIIHVQGGVAICVDSIAHFLMARGTTLEIEGDVLAAYRRCRFSVENEVYLWIIERRGVQAIDIKPLSDKQLRNMLHWREMWMTRMRIMDDDISVVRHAIFLVEKMVHTLGESVAAWIVIDSERAYWQRQHRAALQQKQHHDALGLGWGRHQGCIFRSSRCYFPLVIRLFERLGFVEYATQYDSETGVGKVLMAQEQAVLSCVLEVDLSPHEAEQSFTRCRLPKCNAIGVIDLWCAVHGESLGKGGVHHIAMNFVYDEGEQRPVLREGDGASFIEGELIEGETRPVTSEELAGLIKQGKITMEQGQRLLTHPHLEV